jgi:hypothetical protein
VDPTKPSRDRAWPDLSPAGVLRGLRYFITKSFPNPNKPILPILWISFAGPDQPMTSPRKDRSASPMPTTFRQFVVVLALALFACGLSGCGTINEKISNGMGDYIPQWAGGLPADVPPRRGTPQYDEYMKERERKRLEPAANANAAAPPPTSAGSSLDPVH